MNIQIIGFYDPSERLFYDVLKFKYLNEIITGEVVENTAGNWTTATIALKQQCPTPLQLQKYLNIIKPKKQRSVADAKEIVKPRTRGTIIN